MPYTHLRTFRKRLINLIPDTMFKDESGAWFKAGGDGSVFYALLEQANPDKVRVVSRIVYNYNDTNPLNDYKINGAEQTANARKIINMMNQGPVFTIPEPPKLGENTATAVPKRSALDILKEYGVNVPEQMSAKTNVHPAPNPNISGAALTPPPAAVVQVAAPTRTKKKILIAIPTGRYIEVETFKSIYDLEVPDGYEVEFRYSFGYRIDQVRNLIAHWVCADFDYLFSVDSDISFAPDTLKKLLSHDKDMVSGLYIQRIPGTHALEIYMPGPHGSMMRGDFNQMPANSLIEVAGCGFGCVLVKSEVLRAVGHPQFEYHVALEHKDTVSEDTDFCAKAARKGFKVFADTSIVCNHTGAYTFRVGELTTNHPIAKR